MQIRAWKGIGEGRRKRVSSAENRLTRFFPLTRSRGRVLRRIGGISQEGIRPGPGVDMEGLP